MGISLCFMRFILLKTDQLPSSFYLKKLNIGGSVIFLKGEIYLINILTIKHLNQPDFSREASYD
jgi:hypothetical protein